ncbi:MAG: DUF1294 domain-containing protein [bacterium]|nr:DUF1294 domain-containing protein [bacterium]
MNAEDILSALGEAAGTAGQYLKQFSAWLWGLLQEFFSRAAIGISSWLSSLTLPMAPTILKIFSNKTINAAVFFIVLLYIIFINIYAFILYGSDKKKSQTRKARRISEKSLLKACMLGGAAGGLIGMQVFRHKTLHKKFTILVPLMFAVQLILDSVILGFLGFWAFF